MMDRSVRRKISDNVTGDDTITTATTTTSLISPPPSPSSSAVTDFTLIPDDTLLRVFSLLNHRDRANLAATCRHCRKLSTTASLWRSLDLRAYRFNAAAAAALSRRCSELAVLRFRDAGAANAVVHLRARNLREISGEHCGLISSVTLSVIAARHELLETLVLGPDLCVSICSDAVQAVGNCCPKLRKVRLSGVKEINSDAINAFAVNCVNLVDLGFIDCFKVDLAALGNVRSLRYLSVAGTSYLKWSIVSDFWSKLPNLVGLDVSRTRIKSSAVTSLLSCSQSLRVLCAINCSLVEKDENFVTRYVNEGCFSEGKLLISIFSDVCKGLQCLFPDDCLKGKNVFLDWRDSEQKDGKFEEVMTWLEWILSHSLLRIAKTNPRALEIFWVSQGATLLVILTQSFQEDVRERAAEGLAIFADTGDDDARINGPRAEAVVHSGGVKLLLRLTSSCSEHLQAESTKAITMLSQNAKFAKTVVDEGGTVVLTNLAKSMNRLVAELAAEGLWNLSVEEEHMGAIAEAGGVKALVDLIVKWPPDGDDNRVLECAAGVLANLAADYTCSLEVAAVGGIRALVELARTCKCERVQQTAARALSHMASPGDGNTNNSAVGQEPRALKALLQLTHSPHKSVRQEAANALWNLSLDDHTREALAAAGAVKTLSCSSASPRLHERADGALWALSDSEVIRIAIQQEGGVALLIALARSKAEDVHQPAAAALWNLAFNPGIALCIMEEDGVSALFYLCSTSVSKNARFTAAVALTYIFDGRMDEVVLAGASSESVSIYKSLDDARRVAFEHIEAFLLTFYEPLAFAAAITSSDPDALTHASKAVQIEGADQLSSAPEIGRFVAMLSNPYSILKACAAFALLQLTMPDGSFARHHANLLQNAGAVRPLRVVAAAATVPLIAKVFAKIVLHNLSYHLDEISL